MHPESGTPVGQPWDSSAFTDADLEASMRRLEALNVSVAVYPEGVMQIIAAGDRRPEGSTVWSPGEMLLYVRLNDEERQLVRELKGLTKRSNL